MWHKALSMTPSLVLIFAMFAAGYLCRESGAIPEVAGSDALNRFVIYICTPALVLRYVPGLEASRDLLTLVLVPWALTALAFGVVRLVQKPLGLDRETSAVLVLAVALGNTSFVGFPLCEAILGPQSVPYAVVYDQFGSFLALTTVGLVVVARASGAAAPTPREMMRRIARFPPFIALLVAFGLRLSSELAPAATARLGALVIPAVEPALTRVGDTLVPVAMFAVGLRTRISLPPQRGAFAFGLAAKLFVMPLVAFALVRAFGVAPEIAEVTVLEAGMPPMITAAALAMMAGLAPELCAALVGWGIILSMVTLRMWGALLLG